MEDADIGMADATKPSGLRSRLDPRSGKYVLMQPESFWRDHETRRRANGASVADYCDANGLARSTFQRWVSRLAGGSARRVSPVGRNSAGEGARSGFSVDADSFTGGDAGTTGIAQRADRDRCRRWRDGAPIR